MDAPVHVIVHSSSSKSDVHNYYFVGKVDASLKAAMRKVEEGRAIAKGDARDLDELLGSAPRRPCTFVHKSIFGDDKIAVIMSKIEASVPEVRGKQLYAWATKNVGDRVAVCNQIASSLIRGRVSIPLAELRTSLSRTVGVNIKPQVLSGLSERLRHMELFDLLFGELPEKLPKRLLFEYSREISFVHMFAVDPYNASVDDISETPLSYVDHSATILGDCDLVSPVIHVVSKDVFSSEIAGNDERLTKLYFPSEGEMLVGKQAPDDNVYSALLLDVRDHAQDVSYIKKLYAVVKPVGTPSQPIKPRLIFENYALDTICPMVKLRSQNDITYKIDSEALQLVPEDIVSLWTSEQVSAKEATMFKIYYGSFFATLILYRELEMHVKITSKVEQKMNMDYVEKEVLPAINHVVARLSDLLSLVSLANSVRLPPITREMINHATVMDLQATASFEVTNTLPSVHEIEKRFSDIPLCFHRLYALQSMRRQNSVSLRFKRSSNYNPTYDIRAFVLSHIQSMSRAELVLAIVKSFNLTRAQAEALYNDMEDNSMLSGMYLKMFTGCTVVIQRVNDIKVRVFVKGHRIDSRLASHIIKLVGAVIVHRTAVKLPDKAASLQMDDLFQAARKDDDDDVFKAQEDVVSFEAVAAATEDDAADAEDEEEAKSDAESGDDDKEQDLGGFALQRLQDADPELFGFDTNKKNFTSFAALCASNNNRQPMVVDEERLEHINKKYPGAAEDAVKYGSTPELAKKNAYMCPQVFCKKSRVAMTKKQYDAKGCPDPEDGKPIISKSKKYLGFLDPSRHPKELCIPCCFNVDHAKKSSGALRRRYTKCTAPARGENPEQDAEGNSYVRGTVFPLEDGRLGQLPHSISAILNATSSTEESFLRRGIAHGSRYLLSCLAFLLGLKSGKALCELIKARLQPHEFIPINNGNLLRAFADDNVQFSDPDAYKSFRAWFLSQKEYIEKYSLQKLASAVKARATPFDPREDEVLAAQVQRELMVQAAMQNFMVYLDSAEIEHHQLLELAQDAPQWLNPEGLNFVMLEDGTDSKEDVYVTCMKHLESRYVHREGKQFAMMFRHRQFYEPIVRAGKSAFDTEEVARIVEFQRANCRGVLGDSSAKMRYEVEGFLAAQGSPARKQVLSMDYNVVGFVTDKGLFVPLPLRCNIMDRKMDVVYAVSIVDFCVGKVSLKDASKVFDSLAKRVAPEFYKTSVHPNKIGIVMGDGETYVPVAKPASEHRPYVQMHETDLLIFSGIEKPNKAYEYSQRWFMRDKVMRGHVRSIATALLKDGKKATELEFLRHQQNPFPRDFRIAKVRDLIRASKPDLQMSNVDREKLVDMFLTRDLGMLTAYAGGIFSHNVVMMSQRDVERGTLDKYYKGDVVQRKEGLLKDVTIESGDALPSDQDILFSSDFEPIFPTRIGALFPGFACFKIQLYDFFAVLGKQMRRHKDVTKEMLRSHVMQQLVDPATDRSLLALHPAFSSSADIDDLGRVGAVINMQDYKPAIVEAAILARFWSLDLVVVGTGKDLQMGSPAVRVAKNGGSELIVLHFDLSHFQFRIVIHAASKKYVYSLGELAEMGATSELVKIVKSV